MIIILVLLVTPEFNAVSYDNFSRLILILGHAKLLGLYQQFPYGDTYQINVNWRWRSFPSHGMFLRFATTPNLIPFPPGG